MFTSPLQVRSLLVLAATLFVLPSCGSDGPTEPTTGTIEVTASTTGEDIDSDGYMVSVNGGSAEPLSVNGTVTVTGVPAGGATVQLSGVAANCTVSGQNPRALQVTGGQTTTATFEVACSGRTGSLEVTTTTAGDDLDSDGYTVEADGNALGSIAANDTETFTGLLEGSHVISLSGVASNCTVQNNDQSVDVPFDGTATVSFDVDCAAITGSVNVTTSTSGEDVDSDGYNVEIDGVGFGSIGASETKTFSGIEAGIRTVSLTGVASNCTVQNNNQDVTVPENGTVDVSFAIDCEAIIGADILFETTRDADWEIYVMGRDGSNQTNLTQSPSSTDRLPAWSPDRSKIAFQSNREGSVDIWVMDADGTNATNLTPVLDGTKFIPEWSPDGTEIAFSRTDPSGQTDIWVMDADGTNQRQITNLTSDDQQARWSPDGSKFAFRTDRNGDTEIYVMNADGSNPQNLTNDPTNNDGLPTWSPDGTKIAWTKHLDPSGADDEEIYIMDANGSNPTNLTNHTATDAAPTFSPDGSQIAFYSTRASIANIFIMDVDGSNVVNVTQADNRNQAPSWRAP